MADQCFSMETLVSSTNKTDSQNIAEILLKGMLNTMSITLTLEIQYASIFFYLVDACRHVTVRKSILPLNCLKQT